MKTASDILIDSLIAITDDNVITVQQMDQLTDEELNWKPDEKSWSILECIEHLNLYADFYLPEIQKRILKADTVNKRQVFKSGFLGNYFANAMKPKARLNKMRTFKDKNPIGSNLDREVLYKFINQQKQLRDLLNKSRKVDLNKVKTAISISNLIKFRLGDTFRFVIFHNQRHIAQAQKVIAFKNNIITH